MSIPILNFRGVELSDREYFQRVSAGTEMLSCEYSFTNLFIWRNIYGTDWAELGGFPLVRSKEEKTLLMLAGGSFSPAELRDILSASFPGEKDAGIIQATEKYVTQNPALGDFFSVEFNEDYSDYIHLAETLLNLKGAKLAKKKNLVSQFARNNPDHSIAALEGKHFPECSRLAEEWCLEKTCHLPGITQEKLALKEAFDNYSKLGIEGVVVFAGGKIAAFSVFSIQTPGMCVVHFEKYDRGLKGAAQMINRETAKHVCGRCKYVNREQDLGLPGLRRAKMSYAPELILKNYVLKPKSSGVLPQ